MKTHEIIGGVETIKSLIRLLAQHYGMDPEMMVRQCQVESDFRIDARSPAGADGLFQITEITERELNRQAKLNGQPKVRRDDWRSNIDGGIRYMRYLQQRYHGDIEKALAAYNCGPTKLDTIIERYGEDWKGDLPEETREYLGKVMA